MTGLCLTRQPRHSGHSTPIASAFFSGDAATSSLRPSEGRARRLGGGPRWLNRVCWLGDGVCVSQRVGLSQRSPPSRCIGEVAKAGHYEFKSPFGGRGGGREQVGDCQSRCSLGARSMDGIRLQQTPGSVVGPFLEPRVSYHCFRGQLQPLATCYIIHMDELVVQQPEACVGS